MAMIIFGGLFVFVCAAYAAAALVFVALGAMFAALAYVGFLVGGPYAAAAVCVVAFIALANEPRRSYRYDYKGRRNGW